MTPISTATASGALSGVSDVGTFLITSLTNLAPVLLSIGGILILVGILMSVFKFRR